MADFTQLIAVMVIFGILFALNRPLANYIRRLMGM
jgi:hypothetical protein